MLWDTCSAMCVTATNSCFPILRKHDIEAQIERARKVARTENVSEEVPQANELKREDTDQPLKISVTATQPDKLNGKPPPVPKFDGTFADDGR